MQEGFCQWLRAFLCAVLCRVPQQVLQNAVVEGMLKSVPVDTFVFTWSCHSDGFAAASSDLLLGKVHLVLRGLTA